MQSKGQLLRLMLALASSQKDESDMTAPLGSPVLPLVYRTSTGLLLVSAWRGVVLE